MVPLSYRGDRQYHYYITSVVSLFPLVISMKSSSYVLSFRLVFFYLDEPGKKVANPARGQLNRESEYSPVPVRA